MNKSRYIIQSTHLIHSAVIKTHWPLFLTLTYKNPDGWLPEHITNLLSHYRKFIKRSRSGAVMPYIWRAEMQEKRSTPTIHYHAVIWIPNGIKPPKPDIQGWWPYGWSNVQRAYNPAGYIAKYINKPSLIPLPRRARSYSVQTAKLLVLDFLRIPNWMKYFSRYGGKVQRLKGFGWHVIDTGLCYTSPWAFTKQGPKWIGFKVSTDWPDYYGFSNYKFATVTNIQTGAYI